MKKSTLNRILLLAGLMLLIGVLAVGCAKKPPVKEEAPPAAPIVAAPDTAGQAARAAAEIEAAERAKREAAEKAAREAEQGAKSSLQMVYFDYDKSNLRPDARSAAEFDAGVLQKYASWTATIEGHCDERGTTEYNLALGEKRAGSVKSFFIESGLAADRFQVISYGEERPADPGHAEAAWAKNRRAVLVIK
ncbi:MAG: peptidoglycan-associated lipoprotein Pal [bacterium]|nr:peptidoglycan-associated lipoprotein Pal [bacterium]